jgi:hypothetical protein
VACACVLCAFTLSGVAQQGSNSAVAEKPMTKAQADELLRSVDEILTFASQDTHLQIKQQVKRRIMSRDEVKKILIKKFDEDESAQRMQRSEVVLKKFGLLDRDFHLQPFLIRLLTEQIAGFYEPKTRTVNMLDWVNPDDQRPVLAHELTHALQDQRVNLDKWGNPLAMNISKDVRDDNRHIQMDESNTTRDAVTEGQAMVVYVDYMLRPTGKTLAMAPDLGDKVQDAAASSSGSPLLTRAPLLLQQSLLFPYTSGLSFEQALLRRGGVNTAFAAALDHPPSSSQEILHPEIYIGHIPVPVLAMPDIHPLIDKDWSPYDVGVMGELDVRITAELFGGKEIAAAVAPAWAGGIYYAAQKKSATTPEQRQSTASIGLIYYSQWKNEDSARSFLRVYASYLGRKYSNLKRESQDDNHQVFTTSEGDVVLTLRDKGVFISEGFDRATAEKIDELMRAAQGTGRIQNAAVPKPAMQEPALGLSSWLSGFGMMRAALQTK